MSGRNNYFRREESGNLEFHPTCLVARELARANELREIQKYHLATTRKILTLGDIALKSLKNESLKVVNNTTVSSER